MTFHDITTYSPIPLLGHSNQARQMVADSELVTAAAAAKGASSTIHAPGLVPKKKRHVDHHSKIDKFILGTKDEAAMVANMFGSIEKALSKNGESPQKKKQRSIADISANFATLGGELDSLKKVGASVEEIEEVEALIVKLREELRNAMMQ